MLLTLWIKISTKFQSSVSLKKFLEYLGGRGFFFFLFVKLYHCKGFENVNFF